MAAGYTTVSASQITDSTGTLITNAIISFQPCSSSGSRLSYRVNGNGQAISTAVSTTITNGAMTVQLADTSLTNPVNICYAVTITDKASGDSLLGPGYLIQPSGATWDFDTFIPTTGATALIQAGPTGPQGPAGQDAVLTGAYNGPLTVTNLTATGQVGSTQLVQFPYPNTEGIVVPALDSNGALVGGFTESQSIFAPGLQQLPTGSTVSGANLGLAGTLNVTGAATVQGSLTVGGAFNAGSFSTTQLVQFPYPNTEGIVLPAFDSTGAVVGGFTESQGIYAPGSQSLPAGTVVTGTNLSLPGAVSITGNLTVGGTDTSSQLIEMVYPNTEGATFGCLDSTGQLYEWTGEDAKTHSSADVSQTVTTVTSDISASTTPSVVVYQTQDTGGLPQIAAQNAVQNALGQTAPVETVLTSTSRNFSPSVNADGTISFITNRTGRNRRFKMSSTGTQQFYEELQAQATLFASGAPQLHHVLITGQSLSTGFQSVGITTSQPYANKMFSVAGGVNAVTNGQSGVTLSPLYVGGTWTGGADGLVETIANGFADSVTGFARSVVSDNPSGLTSYDLLISGSGIPGYGYYQICGPTDSGSGLPSGTASFQELVSQVTTGKALSTNGYYVPCVAVLHGETDDHSYVANTFAGTLYGQCLLNWQSDVQTAVQAKTGQTNTVPFLIYQTSDWAAYSGITAPITGLQQLNNTIQYPSKFIMVGPTYQYPRVGSVNNNSGSYDSFGSGGAHCIADGYRWLGEQFSKVFRQVFLQGKPWLPLTPLKFTRTGNVVAIDFHVPYGPLVLDTTHVATIANYGFEYYDDNASATIASVALDAVLTNRVNITLSTVPTGTNKTIRYAYTGVPGANAAGLGLGPRGCLRDSDPTVSHYTSTVTLNMLTTGQPYPMWNWCTVFSYGIN